MILPRQARDKHRENSKKSTVCLQHGRMRGLLHVPGEGANVPPEFWQESSGLHRQQQHAAGRAATAAL
jgi:hypothetical protein